MADAWTATPQGLGQFFSEIVEDIAAKRNNSRAALVDEVKKQFQKQLEDSDKKNKELLAQVKKFNESLTKMQNTNGELSKSLQKLTAQNTQAAKDLNDAKERQRQLEKQLEESLSKNKGCMSGCLGMIAAIVTLTGLASWIICIII